MRIFALLLIVAVGLFTVSWNFWDGEETADAAYFPLKVGYKWTYVVKENDKEIERKSEVTGTEMVGDVECFVVKNPKGTEYCAVDKEGVKMYKTGSKVFNPPLLWLKFPLKKGSEWSYTLPNGLKSNLKNEGEEEIEVPAGKMKCWKISVVGLIGSEKVVEWEVWFARDIGFVKMSDKTGGVETVSELKSFSKGEGKKGNEGEKK